MKIYNHNEEHRQLNDIPAPKEKNRSIILAAVFLCITLVLCALTGLVTGLIVTNKLGDNSKLPNIDYEFEDDHLIGLTNSLYDNVVEIRRQGSYGTGFIFTEKDGNLIVITNFHVAGDGVGAEVRFSGETNFINTNDTTALGWDSYNDVTVLKVAHTPKRSFVDLEKKGLFNFEVVMGQRVLGLGNGLTYGIYAYEGIISKGDKPISLYTNGVFNKTVAVNQTTAPINPGCSGGPLFNMKGEVIGVNTYQAKRQNDEYVDGISYSVSFDIAYKIYLNAVKGYVFSVDEQCGQILYHVMAENTYRLVMAPLGFTAQYKDGVMTIVSIDAGVNTGFRIGDEVIKIGELKMKPDSYTKVISHLKCYGGGSGGIKLIVEVKREGAVIRHEYEDFVKRI